MDKMIQKQDGTTREYAFRRTLGENRLLFGGFLLGRLCHLTRQCHATGQDCLQHCSI